MSEWKNMVGRVFAREYGAPELWTDDGPFPLLREMAFGRTPSTLRDEQKVMLRVALDFYDGSGQLGFAEAFARLEGHSNAVIDLSEFLTALASMPETMESWLEAHGYEGVEVRQVN